MTTTLPPLANPLRRSRFAAPGGRREWFTIGSVIAASFYAVACLVPFWIIVSSSLTDESLLNSQGFSFFPSPFSWKAYEIIFGGSAFVLNAFLASVVITIVGTALALSATSGLAWVI